MTIHNLLWRKRTGGRINPDRLNEFALAKTGIKQKALILKPQKIAV
jgi:hypothetical protein